MQRAAPGAVDIPDSRARAVSQWVHDRDSLQRGLGVYCTLGGVLHSGLQRRQLLAIGLSPEEQWAGQPLEIHLSARQLAGRSLKLFPQADHARVIAGELEERGAVGASQVLLQLFQLIKLLGEGLSLEPERTHVWRSLDPELQLLPSDGPGGDGCETRSL